MRVAYCINPHRYLLTKWKEYEIIKELSSSYIIRRDDRSIDRMDKSRFTTDPEEFDRLQKDAEKWNKYYLSKILEYEQNKIE